MVEAIALIFFCLFLYVLWVNRILRSKLRDKNAKIINLRANYERAFNAGRQSAYKEVKGEISETIRKVKNEGSPDV